jgi:hypothetical protein
MGVNSTKSIAPLQPRGKLGPFDMGTNSTKSLAPLQSRGKLGPFDMGANSTKSLAPLQPRGKLGSFDMGANSTNPLAPLKQRQQLGPFNIERSTKSIPKLEPLTYKNIPKGKPLRQQILDPLKNVKNYSELAPLKNVYIKGNQPTIAQVSASQTDKLMSEQNDFRNDYYTQNSEEPMRTIEITSNNRVKAPQKNTRFKNQMLKTRLQELKQTPLNPNSLNTRKIDEKVKLSVKSKKTTKAPNTHKNTNLYSFADLK